MRLSIFLTLFVVALCGCGDTPPTIDGRTYKTVKIGDQEWFSENLKTTVYANGEEIPYSRTDESWTTQEMGMRCSYDHDEARSAQYGQLYNWYAVNDKRGLCPTGWRAPSDEDWQDLEVFLGMSRADVSLKGKRGSGELGIGTKLKAKSGWENDGNGKDDYGFSALPGGNRYDYNGSFTSAGFYGYWWSSSPSGGNAWRRNLNNDYPGVNRFSNSPRLGFSVRCLRDAD
ncbi:fibrobacter succinogenes major paralogous domain-containing protein [Flavobacteriales bacterium]|nr:fibrobacter succinogenes major paralogous domain-containing protein [Flavobacteriales bacterium]